jgi:diaminopimelate decarboxylase
MSDTPDDRGLALGGIPLAHAMGSLRRVESHARAYYLYDLDQVLERARRFQRAVEALAPRIAYALKANALPALLEPLAGIGLSADAASLGELELARAAGFDTDHRILNGNGKTPEELEWAVRHGVWALNADHVGELDALEQVARMHGQKVRVALRVNPGIETPGHRYVATGDDEAKFGIAPGEALAAWESAASRWPHLQVDGLHLHVGSQLLEPEPLERALDVALDLRDEASRRGARLGLINLGGGFGIDYEGEREFPLERFGAIVSRRLRDAGLDLAFEPGRWLVATAGVLVAEVLWIKQRDGRRFVVLAAGMNDFLRPALYGARHRIVAVRPRPGPVSPAAVVGPVCESADVFDPSAMLPPLEPGDLLAIRDVGAYGASMASHYNGRPRLAELLASAGRLILARPGQSATTPAIPPRTLEETRGA